MNIEDLAKNVSDKVYEQNQDVLAEVSDCPGVVTVNDYEGTFSTKSGVTPNRHIVLDGEKYFVKYPTLGEDTSEIDATFREIFASFVAEKVGVKCTDQKLLIDHKRKAIGVISKDFGEHFTYSSINTEKVDGNFHVDQMMDTLKKAFKDDETMVIDYDKLRYDINQMFLFDYLTKQVDRHGGNIAFQIIENDNGTRTIELAPMYDNANSFDRQVEFNVNSFVSGNHKVFGVDQQYLLNGQFKDMLGKFKELFSEENYPKLMEEFTAYCGADKLMWNYDYDYLVKSARASVNNRIADCEARVNETEQIDFPVIYTVFQRHKDEIKDLNAFKKALVEYYDEDKSTEFIEGKASKLSLHYWKYYNECVELAKEDRIHPIINDELERKEKDLSVALLKLTFSGEYKKTGVAVSMNRRFDYYFNDGKIPYIENTGNFKASDYAYDCIHSYRLIKRWIDSQVGKDDKETTEQIAKASDVRRNYVKFLNRQTNKNLTVQQNQGQDL